MRKNYPKVRIFYMGKIGLTIGKGIVLTEYMQQSEIPGRP
jgi:hypothetical protein